MKMGVAVLLTFRVLEIVLWSGEIVIRAVPYAPVSNPLTGRVTPPPILVSMISLPPFKSVFSREGPASVLMAERLVAAMRAPRSSIFTILNPPEGDYELAIRRTDPRGNALRQGGNGLRKVLVRLQGTDTPNRYPCQELKIASFCGLARSAFF